MKKMNSKFSEWYITSKSTKADGIYEICLDCKSDASMVEGDGKKWKNLDGTSVKPKKWPHPRH